MNSNLIPKTNQINLLICKLAILFIIFVCQELQRTLRPVWAHNSANVLLLLIENCTSSLLIILIIQWARSVRTDNLGKSFWKNRLALWTKWVAFVVEIDWISIKFIDFDCLKIRCWKNRNIVNNVWTTIWPLWTKLKLALILLSRSIQPAVHTIVGKNACTRKWLEKSFIFLDNYG